MLACSACVRGLRMVAKMSFLCGEAARSASRLPLKLRLKLAQLSSVLMPLAALLPRTQSRLTLPYRSRCELSSIPATHILAPVHCAHFCAPPLRSTLHTLGSPARRRHSLAAVCEQ